MLVPPAVTIRVSASSVYDGRLVRNSVSHASWSMRAGSQAISVPAICSMTIVDPSSV
jgi:hypothetical protein